MRSSMKITVCADFPNEEKTKINSNRIPFAIRNWINFGENSFFIDFLWLPKDDNFDEK